MAADVSSWLFGLALFWWTVQKDPIDCVSKSSGLMLYCGMGIGYRDLENPVNQYRSERADLEEFCTFLGFD